MSFIYEQPLVPQVWESLLYTAPPISVPLSQERNCFISILVSRLFSKLITLYMKSDFCPGISMSGPYNQSCRVHNHWHKFSPLTIAVVWILNYWVVMVWNIVWLKSCSWIEFYNYTHQRLYRIFLGAGTFFYIQFCSCSLRCRALLFTWFPLFS